MSADASIDDAKQSLVCRRAAQRRTREIGTPAAVATSAMTERALRLEERPPALDVDCGELGTLRWLESNDHVYSQEPRAQHEILRPRKRSTGTAACSHDLFGIDGPSQARLG